MRIADLRQTCSGALSILGCQVKIPYPLRGWPFTSLRPLLCRQDGIPSIDLHDSGGGGNTPLRIVTRFLGLTWDLGTKTKAKKRLICLRKQCLWAAHIPLQKMGLGGQRGCSPPVPPDHGQATEWNFKSSNQRTDQGKTQRQQSGCWWLN